MGIVKPQINLSDNTVAVLSCIENRAILHGTVTAQNRNFIQHSDKLLFISDSI